MKTESERRITELVQLYFEGLHHADIKKLGTVFSYDCVLKAPGVRRNLGQWLELVQNRPVPAEQDAPYAYEILSMEVLGDQAMVKVSVPLLGSDFIDYLGLLKEDGKWSIVNKMYADKPLGG